VRFALTALAATAVLAASPLAHALEVSTQVSTQRVGVGESFYVQLTVMADGDLGALSDARLALPPGMTATGPSASPRNSVFIMNGQTTRRSGATLSWTVTATKVGTFRLGPPSVAVGAERAQGRPVQVEVVAGGTSGGPARSRRGGDPFDFLDPFGRGSSLFPPGFNLRSPFDDDEPEQPDKPEEPSYPDEFRVDKLPDPLAFLRTTLTPTQVVVGQQVTLRAYAYGGRGGFNLENPTEPSHADFLAIETGPENVHPYLVPVGGTRFVAVKIRELPLFPLHAGTLRAGNTKAAFVGRGYPASPGSQGLQRESNWAEVTVVEPPLRGRPPGYKIGDVGEYQLSATVEPRQILAGESIAVVATLAGIGNVPFKVQTPEVRGVEWMEPSLTEKMETPNGVVQGSRTFSYVVRLNDVGNVELGELTLPFYNPKRRQYEIARAQLGAIEVKPNPNAKVSRDEPKANDRLAGVLRPRTALGAGPRWQKPLTDRSGFWASLLLAPFGVVLAGGLLSVTTRARAKMRERGSSLEAQLAAALHDAKKLATSDTPASVAAVERAVFLSIELKLGLKARAILKTELARTLVQRGVSEARARSVSQILEECDTLRFVGAPSGIDPVDLAHRAAALSAELQREKLSSAS
jgi:hypothetical protein